MDIKSLMSKLESISSMTKVAEAGDPAAYKDAQTKMANLEKAAQYNGDDPIVRSRMGLPPKLPPIDQWDGTQPAPVGKPDWVAQLTTLGGAGQAQQTAVKQNAAIDTSNTFIKDKLAKLNDLVAQLTKSSATPASATESIQLNGAISKVISESFGYSLYEAEVDKAGIAAAGAAQAANQQAAGTTAPAGQAAPAAGGDIVSQIQAIMSELGDMGDDPAVAKALADAQKAIDASKAAAGAASGAAGKVDPQKLAKFKELLDKAAKKPAAPGAVAGSLTKKPAPEGGSAAQQPADAQKQYSEDTVSEDDSILAMIRSIKV